MISSFASKVFVIDKDNCTVATNIFQGYANKNFEGKVFWDSIEIDFNN